MALRSIVPELDEMCKSSEDNSAAESDEHESLVDEMEQLLDEVDQAAADDQDSADPAAGQGSGEACSDIKSVIQKMKSTKVVIIPDVSLEPDRSPIGEPEEDDDVVIVEEIKKPRIKISSFARIVPISDDDDVTVIERPKQDLSSNYEHVDMDLSCENDAEIQFFKDQIDPEKQKDAPFPPSVWQILSQPPPPPPPPQSDSSESTPTMSSVMTFSNDEERYEAFLRAVFSKGPSPASPTSFATTRKRRKSEESRQLSSGEADSATPKKPRKSANLENEEDVDSLRASLLISMIEKRKLKEKQILKSKTKASPKPRKSAAAAASKLNPDLQKLKDDVECQRRHFPNIFRKVVIAMAGVSDDDDDAVDDDGSSRGNVAAKQLGNDFFANMENFLKSVRQQTSQEKKKSTPPPKPVRKNPPGRTSRPVAAKTLTRAAAPAATGARKVAKAPVVASAAPKASVMRAPLSSKMKQNLMTSSIALLPPEKQADYKRLTAVIAKKERDKLLKLKQQKEQQQLSSARPSKPASVAAAVATPEDDEDDDAELLRSKLIASLQVKNKMVPVNKDETADQNTQVSSSPSMQESSSSPIKADAAQAKATGPRTTIPVLLHRKVVPRETSSTPPPAVESPVPKEVAGDENKKELEKDEQTLLSCQGEIMQDIFKLSAQMSQLKEEAKTLEAAKSFAEDLKRQLAEAEAIIERSSLRSEQLRSQMRVSITDIATKRVALVKTEENCRKKGVDVVGSTYKLPQAPGCQDIKKKLALIKKNSEALQLMDRSAEQTQTSRSESCSSPNVTLVTPEPPPEAVVVAAAVTTTATEVSTTATLEVSTTASSEESTTATSEESTTTPSAVPKPDLLTASLAHLRTDTALHLDPHTQICQFELQGKCNDDRCPYQHYQPRPQTQ